MVDMCDPIVDLHCTSITEPLNIWVPIFFFIFLIITLLVIWILYLWLMKTKDDNEEDFMFSEDKK